MITQEELKAALINYTKWQRKNGAEVWDEKWVLMDSQNDYTDEGLVQVYMDKNKQKPDWQTLLIG